MESAKSKKQLRRENKLRKVAALLEITELNDRDRLGNTLQLKMSARNSKTEGESDHESEEPVSKKFKSSNEAICSNSSQPENSKEAESQLKLSEADLAELRSLLRERRKELKQKPHLTLKQPSGVQADLDVSSMERIPIFFSDIQHLVLFGVLAQNSPFIPRWCTLDKCGHLSAVQILFIEGAGVGDYLQNKESIPSLAETKFPYHLEVIMPAAYNGNLIEEFCSIPLSKNQRNNLVSAYGSLEAAAKSSCEVFRVLRAFFPVKEQSSDEAHASLKKETDGDLATNEEPKASSKKETVYLPKSDKFSRTQLLLSAWQLIEEGYPIPLNGFMTQKFKDFVLTKSAYKEVNNFSPMYGLDCEMCITDIGKSECVRVSIVNEKLETVLDTLVLPYNKITNYLTRFSGITSTMMKDVTTRLEDVQKFIQENIEPDAILVGQSLNFDLMALKMMHPYCIDTSVIFNVTGDRYRKSKLSYLADQFLKETIQINRKGHCSVEDSSAALKLVQLKLSQSIDFGDQVLASQRNSDNDSKEEALRKFKLQENSSDYGTSLYSYASRMGKHTSIMACPEILEKYMDYLNPRIAAYENITIDGSSEVISREEQTETGRVTCVITPSHETVAAKVATKVQDNFLSIGHIRLSEQESNSLGSGDHDTVERLNKWVEAMQKSAPSKSLSIVLLCGREKSANGVCFLRVHTESQGCFNFQPKES